MERVRVGLALNRWWWLSEKLDPVIGELMRQTSTRRVIILRLADLDKDGLG